VIAIIGILAVVVLINLCNARIKGRDTRRIEDVNQIRKAIEVYYNDCGQYPSSLDPSTADAGCPAGVTFGDLMNPAPADPNGTAYAYTYDSSTNTFAITFTLEGTVENYGPGAHSMTQDGITTP